MAKVIVFGNGQMASVAWAYLTHDSDHEVVAFTVDREYIKTPIHEGLPVVSFEDVKDLYPPDCHDMLVMISYNKVNRLREAKYNAAKEKGYSLISYISPKASVWPDVEVGDNCFIMDNNVIQPGVSIGCDTIIWSGNHIGHHTTIGKHCFLASHVVVSGSVTIGDYTFLGVNSTSRDNITVAESCVVGAGALILRSTKPNEVYMGERTKPSRVTSDRLPGI